MKTRAEDINPRSRNMKIPPTLRKTMHFSRKKIHIFVQI